MKILIPAAGAGSRFVKAGYKDPKPFINVAGKPMIRRVVENIGFPNCDHIFLVQSDTAPKLVREVADYCPFRSVIEVKTLTEGAACTALLAKDIIDTEEDLLIANADQLVNFNRLEFDMLRAHVDGVIFCFAARDRNPKWSYVRTNRFDEIIEVAEKDPISDLATCGVYWFNHGKDFVRLAEKMIQADKRVSGEFYIAPVFNEMIQEGGLVEPLYTEMIGLGTPEDLEKYLAGLSD